MRLPLKAPQPLASTHQVDHFNCTQASLDAWLKRRAMANQVSGACRTFVVADQESRIYGYYAMAAGVVSNQVATGTMRHSMADPIPVLVLARLAVDQRAQDMHLGAAMLQDALKRVATVVPNSGVRALLVHALNDRAKQFYTHYGFQESPQNPMTLMLRLGSLT